MKAWGGTYGHHVSEAHLKRYLGEFDFRYNERAGLGVDVAARAAKALKSIKGKRLTYRGLTKPRTPKQKTKRFNRWRARQGANEMAIHPSIGRVTKVRHTLLTTSGWAHFNSDLIFVGGVPTVVVEWEMGPEGDLPAVTIPLDPRRLHKLGWESAEYMYEDGIEDPRGPQSLPYRN